MLVFTDLFAANLGKQSNHNNIGEYLRTADVRDFCITNEISSDNVLSKCKSNRASLIASIRIQKDLGSILGPETGVMIFFVVF
jgi:hypothetical protein